MKPIRTLAALHKAHASLLERIDSARAAGLSRLPSIALLARSAGVSYVTMWKAVAALKAQGVLQAAPRKGISLTGFDHFPPPSTGSPVDTAQPHWERIAESIARDIHDGRTEPGQAIAAPKTLQRAFGAAYRTVRSALRALAADGLIEQHGRTYRVAALNAGVCRARVAVIMRGDRTGNLHLFYSQRAQEFFRVLENECSRSAIDLVTVACDVSAGTFHGARAGQLSAAAVAGMDVLGYVSFATGIPPGALDEIFRRLLAPAKRVSILDETDSAIFRAQTAQFRHMRLFALGLGPIHGEIMGRFVAGIGRRTVAYISSAHNALWSRNRFEGLRRALETRGARAVTFVCDTPQEIISRRRIRKVTADTVARMKRFAALKNNPLVEDIVPVVAQLYEQTRETLDMAVPHAQLERLFSECIKDSSIDTWVCGNDMMAREALAFLSRRGVRVPDTIAVAGFDDTEREFRQNLTSYNHNMTTIVQRMLGHVLDSPLARRRSTAAAPEEIEGFVNARRTT